MASSGSKGNTKRTSPLQKAHYETYRMIFKRRTNKIKKLKRRIRLNAKMIARKAKRKPPRIVKVDRGAIAALKLLTN